jgi:hypothetical protein
MAAISTSTKADLADFLRRQARKCLQIAHQIPNPSISIELIVIAARLHDHATKLERSAQSRQAVDAAS